MDLGFGGFLEKFEDHFGGGLTKALLILIGLTVATLCGSVLWTYLLLPIAELIPDGKSGPAYQFAKLALILAIALMLVNQLLGLADNYLRSRLRRQMHERLDAARKILGDAEKNNVQAQKFNADAQADVVKAKDYLAAAEMTMERLLSYAFAHGMLTQAEVEELRSLMET
jgi:hypothetical protein